MKLRGINRVVRSTAIDMDGFKVDQPLPNFGMEQHDPYLLIHHANHNYDGGMRPNEVGVGPHPHRGFSPVTIIFKGEIHHRDSRGNDMVVREGGLQWMNAGMGVIHSERPSTKFAREGGQMEIIQIWINSPKANKMDQPFYQPIQLEDVPMIQSPDGLAKLFLYAGKYDNKTGPANSITPVTIMRIDLKKGAEINLDTDTEHNVMLYQLNGATQVNDRESGPKRLIVFENQAGEFSLKATEDSQLVLLSGKPIGEPVSKYGPYVMNTQTELLEAMRDYQMGKMGVLIEEFD